MMCLSHNEKRLKTSDATLDKIFTKDYNTFILSVSNVSNESVVKK